MAETAHTGWYRQGTVSVTNGSTKVSGNGTKFLTAGINPGATFRLDAKSDYACEVASVVSDTELQLVKPYYGQSASGQTYSIDRNHQSTLLADLAARLSKAMGNWEARYDLDMATITGESAYEIAKRLGKTSAATEAAWIDELKAGSELVALKALVDPILVHNSGAHNALYRGKNLGVFSDAQSAAIRSGEFAGTTGGVYADIYPGDFWVFSNIPYSYIDENDEEKSSTYSGTMRVADLDYYLRSGDNIDLGVHHAVVIPDTNMFTAPMNDTNTTEGGYVGSKMRTKYLRRAEAIFKACFGENHILSHREYLVNAVANGRASGGAWCDSVVELLDERMAYGAPIFDSASTDGGDTIPNRYSVGCKQLNLFRHRPDLISNRQWYWLRNVVSAAYFADVISIANCSYNSASTAGSGVRPDSLPARLSGLFLCACEGKEETSFLPQGG
ncbi:MAG: hypothetical protein IJU48_07455 [Synergistaceae bacterium]|nr:hypothetical protein [Synergistaceae bacterium]